jgi:hypothetical protein
MQRTIIPDQIEATLRLKGLSGCSGLDVAPDQASVAVACSGRWHGTSTADASASAIVGVELTPVLREIWRMPASHFGPRAFGFDVAFADANRVLAQQLGDSGPPLVNDVVFAIDIVTGGASTLSVGPCSPDCGLCFIADAQRRRIHRLAPASSWSLTDFDYADPTGLPPRLLTFF